MECASTIWAITLKDYILALAVYVSGLALIALCHCHPKIT